MSLADFLVLRKPLAEADRQRILALPEWGEDEPGQVYGARHSAHRKSTVAWADDDSWVFRLVAKLVRSANRAFQMKLKYQVEAVQLTTYGPGQYYDWHMDKGSYMHSPISTRRLGVTIQLTDSAEYTGGRLQFNLGEQFEAPVTLGAVVVFPSYVLHRVTSVEKGIRKSLVSWVR